MRDWIDRRLDEALEQGDPEVLVDALVAAELTGPPGRGRSGLRFEDVRAALPRPRRRRPSRAVLLGLAAAAGAALVLLVPSTEAFREKGDAACCGALDLRVETVRSGAVARLPSRTLPRDHSLVLTVAVQSEVWTDLWALDLDDRRLVALGAPERVAAGERRVTAPVYLSPGRRHLLIAFATRRRPTATSQDVLDALAELGEGRACTLEGRPCSVAWYQVEVE